MIILLSPAKTLNFETPPPTNNFTTPAFVNESEVLINILKKLSEPAISKLMNISSNLATLNASRYSSWSSSFSLENSKQALFAFQGDVYEGLKADTFSPTEIKFSQNHLRILSGLHGILKPLDLIKPYRLEMGTKLQNPSGKNLYHFWMSKVTKLLRQKYNKTVIVNLASNEYSKVIDKKSVNAPIISPVFKDKKNGEYKIISFYAKKARGMMARFIIENQLTQVDDLKSFNSAGYVFNGKLSKPEEPVFLRDNL